MSSTTGKVISCRAAILWAEGKPLTVENITVDPPKTGEVRVRMVSAGLCASDAHFIWGWETDIKLDFEGNPVILGHEGAGIVESVGPDVTTVKAGDHVMLLWMPECGHCQLCSNPMTNFCLTANLNTTLFHENRETRHKINGKALLSLAGTSCFSEYSVVREIQLAKIDSSADLKNVCIIGCAVGTGYGSAINIAKVHTGAKCAVWGLGAIGLSTILGCKEAGAQKIIGVDINPDKEAIARKFGCTDFVNPKAIEEPIENVFQKDGGLDFAFDCIGNKQVLDSACNSLSPWGALTVIGLGARGNQINVKVSDLINGRKILGGLYGAQKPRSTNQQLVSKYISGSLPIDDLITHRIRLDDINQGFDNLKNGKTIRTLIQF